MDFSSDFSSEDFSSVDPADVGIAVLQELWNKVAEAAKELIKETKDVGFEKETFGEFSKQLAELNVLLQTMHSRRVEIRSSGQTRNTLEKLYSQLKKGSKIIKEYKSGSRFHLVMNSGSVLKQMHELADEIAERISLLQLDNTDLALDVKSKMEQIINNLRSIEFQSAVATENIESEIDKLVPQNGENRDRRVALLHRIAKAVGANRNDALTQNELALLKRQKEETEARKNQAEAFQLSQIIEFLQSSETVQSPPPTEQFTTNQPNYGEAFTCPLCRELMMDPVVTVCGHSFERKAIQEHFARGETSCPICNQELPCLELTPNISLRSTIEESKQREADFKFETAVSGIDSSNPDTLSKALDDLQALITVPRYAAMATEKKVISKMVEFLKPGCSNAALALQCLYHLSCFCDENKEAIVRAGATHYIVKRLYTEPEAIAILLELSAKETLATQIGETKDCILLLVSLLHSSISEASEKAREVLQNLSWNIHFVIKMAEAGYFVPFIARFNQGPSDTRAAMAAALLKFQISDTGIANFEDKLFVRNLILMLSASPPACRTTGLKCIKKLLVYQKMVTLFLADTTISFLIGLVSFVNSEEHSKLEAAEVLTSLIETSELADLQELQSKHNITLFTRLATTSEPRLKSHFLQLLLVLAHKSETARNLIRSDMDAVVSFFSSLIGEQPEVKLRVMKLIYCIGKDHPAGIPLPVSPANEQAINDLVTILVSSQDIKEKSTAAGIISRLPAHDIVVDEILSRSEALKAIHEVICATDNEHFGITPIDSKDSDESLLENALAVLIRYTQPTKPELQRQVFELQLYTPLVRVLYRGSSLAKQQTATALAHLSQSTNLSINNANTVSNQPNIVLLLNRLVPRLASCWPASSRDKSMCSVHGSACSSRHAFCLFKADAVGPLVETLSEMESGAADAALMALNTLLTGHGTLSDAVTTIVDNNGMAAILDVLERGTTSAKDKALDLLHKILQHTVIPATQSKRAERILIQLLTENALKKKVAPVLVQMKLLPEQSSYF